VGRRGQTRKESQTAGHRSPPYSQNCLRGYNFPVGGFFSFTDDIERIIMRQLGNRFLWIITLAGLFLVFYMNGVQRFHTRWPTENLLAMLNFVLEMTLVLGFIVIIAWERRAASRIKTPRGDLPGNPGYAYKFYIACVLVLLVITGLHLGQLCYFQYVHILTVLQRGFLVWMTCAMLPAFYLLINTRGAGGMRSIGAVVVSLIILAVLEIAVVTISRFAPGWERLGDIYYWNMLFRQLQQEKLWLVIYNPWLALYFLSYAGVNIMLFLFVVLRVQALRRRGVQA
jgi:hypothetical protein